MENKIYIISVVLVKNIPTGFNILNKLYTYNWGECSSIDEAIGKTVKSAKEEFPEHLLHTVTEVTLEDDTAHIKQEVTSLTALLTKSVAQISDYRSLLGKTEETEIEKEVNNINASNKSS